MKTGIIGLPQVGKTSLFVMLTKQQVTQRSGNPREAHLGVTKVPDDRLDRLAAQSIQGSWFMPAWNTQMWPPSAKKP